MTLHLQFPSLTIEKNKRRSAVIAVYPDDKVVVRVPHRMPIKAIEDWIRSKADWIQKRLHHNAQWRQKNPPKAYISGEMLLYLGKEMCLNLKQEKKTRVYLEGDFIHVCHAQFEEAGDHKAMVIKLLSKWYKAQAQDILQDRIEIYAPQIGRPYADVRYKKLKTRWGSCSSKGNLNFNWALVMAPLDIIDYVVVHELCHLVHHHHKPSFWNLVGKYYPRYEEAKKWLRIHGGQMRIES